MARDIYGRQFHIFDTLVKPVDKQSTILSRILVLGNHVCMSKIYSNVIMEIRKHIRK